MRKLTFGLAIASAGLACGPPAPIGSCAEPTLADYQCDGTGAVTTSQAFDQVVNPRCVSTCHKAGGSASSYGVYGTAAALQSAAVNKKSIFAGARATLKVVDPRELQNSTFWLKVLGGAAAGRRGPQCESPGRAMPGDGPDLTESEKAVLKGWICAGADP